MRKRLAQFVEWWRTFRWGEPCPKHPGHRVREMDMDELMPMCGDMCSECYAEIMARYRMDMDSAMRGTYR